MELFIGLVIIIGIYYSYKKKTFSKNNPNSSDINISVSLDTSNSSSLDNPDTGSIVASDDGGFIINPKSTFPLTIYNLDETTVKELKQILEDGYSEGAYSVIQRIVPLATRYNVRCKEVDDYIKQFKPLYLKSIKEQIQNSPEWSSASDLDKEDLLDEFRNIAISSLYIQPNCNLKIIFENESMDVTIDDVLIDRYGYDVIRFYLGRKKGTFIIPSNHYNRKSFEKLVEAGLANRGDNISITLILEGLKLKEMASLVSDLNPSKFTRKAKAIEYLLNVPDIKNRLSKVVSYRSLFQIKPLPSEFANIDLNQVSSSWQYAIELSELICGTYYSAGYSIRNKKNHMESVEHGVIKGWKIFDVDDNRQCPYCQRASKLNYSLNQYPNTPFHIGCRCHVSTILRGDY